jgi:hypothetical protein
MAITNTSAVSRSSRYPDMDVEDLIASYEAREPRYTERDFMRRWAQIKSVRTMGMVRNSADRAPDDRMVALLASGRVSDAEYFRLAGLLGVDSAGLIYTDPSVQPSFAELLRAGWKAFVRFLTSLRRN